MSPGAKVFLTLAGIGGIFGVLAIAASNKSGAATLPPKADGGGSTVVVPPSDADAPTVVPSEPEGGISRGDPFAVPGIQDGSEASGLLLRWFATEGQSLVAGDTASDRPVVPGDYGSLSSDLDGSFGQRTRQVAAAFEHYNGLPTEDGILTNALLLALRRWAQSQQLPPEALPPRNTPATPSLPPIVLPSSPPSPSSGPPLPPVAVPLPPIMPQSPPVVPVPPFIPGSQGTQAGPPPFVPPAPPVTLPSVPPSANPLPPLPTQPAGGQAPPPGATNVSADTAEMVNALLLAEQSKGWNRVEPTVQAWQSPRGLKADGLFGPKTALTVAETFGTVPIIRVWPAGSQKAKALQDYRAALLEIADNTTDPVRAKQLRVSAQREQGQGFGPKRGTAAALPTNLQVSLAKVA